MKAKKIIDFEKINKDRNGNPRYVCHFLNFITQEESKLSISEQYELAIKKAKNLGGKKYHNKNYGGGIVFQCFNIKELEASILALIQEKKRYTKKAIPDRYFNELVSIGHTVPRYTGGNVINFTVSKKYIIINEKTKTEAIAICTQDCPCALKLFTDYTGKEGGE